jgi:hypothetical protein
MAALRKMAVADEALSIRHPAFGLGHAPLASVVIVAISLLANKDDDIGTLPRALCRDRSHPRMR